jgi:GNAT superfamily N-acetyltransferase
LVKFVPYDEKTHRGQFFELNVEFLTWYSKEMLERSSVNAEEMVGKTISEYVESFLDDFVKIHPPEGIIYVLEVEDKIVGMGAVKKLEKGVGEIKRMYIRPEYRGRGFGKELLKKLIDKAKEFGFSTVRLESAKFMPTAHHIYRSVGFKERDSYSGGETPEWALPHCIFMEKML